MNNHILVIHGCKQLGGGSRSRSPSTTSAPIPRCKKHSNTRNELKSRSMDAYYVRQVWLDMLTSVEQGGAGHLAAYHNTTRVGDSGACFLSWKTAWLVSTFHRDFGKKVSYVFYCKRHAYSDRDRHGAALNSFFEKQDGSRYRPETGLDHACGQQRRCCLGISQVMGMH